MVVKLLYCGLCPPSKGLRKGEKGERERKKEEGGLR
jgi:hypothetical protein